MRNAGEKLHGVLAENLQIPLRPAHALPPGLGKARGLLIIEHRTSCVADLFPAGNIVDGKFDVLREQEEVPPTAPLKHTVREQKSCAGHRAAAAEAHARIVQVLCLAQEPQRIARRDPVVAIVFGIAIAGHDLVARGVDLFDLGKEVRVKDIVCIQHKIGVVVPAAGTANASEHVVEHIALANMQRVVPLKNDRAMLARHAGGIVRAVIRTDVNIYMIHRISLRTNAVEQITDDILLIARSNENGNAVVFIAADKFLPLQQRHRHIKELIGIAYEKEGHDDRVDRDDCLHNRLLHCRKSRHLLFSCLWKSYIMQTLRFHCEIS